MASMKSNSRKRKLLLAGLFLFMLMELAMQTFWRNEFGMHISPIVSMLSGLAVAVLAFLLIGFKSEESNNYSVIVANRRKGVWLLTFSLGAMAIAYFLYTIFETFPIDAKASDIIPSLEMYVRRLLAGEVVYRPLPFEGYSVDPTYFPMLWSPYIFSELLGIDYRWTAYTVFLVAIFLHQRKLIHKDIPIFELVGKTIFPFLMILILGLCAAGDFGLAVELLPVGFYLLLTLSIFERRPLLMALGILICLLSRYAFTFWLPVYLLIYWVEFGFFKVFRVSLYVLLGVVAIYIIPFLSKDWMILQKGLDYYEKTAVGQWKPQIWQDPTATPHHLSRGLSLAIYFYEYDKYELKDRLTLNRKAHITVCAITALLILLGYFFYRKKGLNTRLYLIIGLKLYLVIFYGFFYVPFSYLFQLPLFLSIPILYNVSFLKRGGS